MRTHCFALSLAAFLLTSGLGAQSRRDLFRGSDGGFDVSGFLATRGGFLPAPIIVTEPAVGYGGGVAAAFFHGGNPLQQTAPQPGKRLVPPSITALGAFATENGSRGGGIGHLGVWKDDHVRYLAFLAAADLDLEYWGSTGTPAEQSLDYSIRGAMLGQRLMFRIGDSPLMVGGEWTYSSQEAEFEAAVLPPDAPPRRLDQQDSGVAVVGEWETLDNILSPTRGLKGRVRGKVFSESLGGDNDRRLLDVEGFGYVPLSARVLLGLRADLQFSDGDTPFYLLPFVAMRGLPAVKYSGKHVGLVEVEAQWNVAGRWSVVGFGGLGYAAPAVSDLGGEDRVGTFGAGFRYLLAEQLGLKVGVDLARGPDDGDEAIYLIVGTAWR